MANSVDPDQTALPSSVMLGNYLQQMTSADDIFRFILFLVTFRVKISPIMLIVDRIFFYFLKKKINFNRNCAVTVIQKSPVIKWASMQATLTLLHGNNKVFKFHNNHFNKQLKIVIF